MTVHLFSAAFLLKVAGFGPGKRRQQCWANVAIEGWLILRVNYYTFDFFLCSHFLGNIHPKVEQKQCAYFLQDSCHSRFLQFGNSWVTF